MIIVVIIMGILAAVITPQISTSTEDAKLSTLKTDLKALRSAVEIYYVQHNNTYPGAKKRSNGDDTVSDVQAALSFVDQLILYTQANGVTSGTKTATAKYGPYVKGGELPTNTYNECNAVVCDFDEDDITIRDWDGVGTAGWRFFPVTGVLVANDSAAHAAL
jgi:type II secretory pathway pseudopilin PulG